MADLHMRYDDPDQRGNARDVSHEIENVDDQRELRVRHHRLAGRGLGYGHRVRLPGVKSATVRRRRAIAGNIDLFGGDGVTKQVKLRKDTRSRLHGTQIWPSDR